MEEKYFVTTDVFPPEGKEQNKLYPFYEFLRKGRLTTTQCQNCGEISWPPRTICPKCLSNQLNWVDLPKKGKIRFFTVQLAGVPPGFEPPLIIALIDFEKNFSFMSRIVKADPEKLKVGDEVELEILHVKGDRVIHAFKPNKA
jgi:uncharacterized OB-fold protein